MLRLFAADAFISEVASDADGLFAHRVAIHELAVALVLEDQAERDEKPNSNCCGSGLAMQKRPLVRTPQHPASAARKMSGFLRLLCRHANSLRYSGRYFLLT